MINDNFLDRVYECVPALSSMYCEPQRSYHSITHIHELLRNILGSRYESYIDHSRIEFIKSKGIKYLTDGHPSSVGDVLIATAWFHDCYYDPIAGSPANEKISANIAANMLMVNTNDSNYDEKYKATIKSILLTSQHTKNILKDPPPTDVDILTLEGLIFMDLDIFSFSDEKQMNVNSIKIREEYPNVSDVDYLNGRCKFLQTMLNKDRIYYTFNDSIELSARQNIAKEIDKCKKSLELLSN